MEMLQVQVENDIVLKFSGERKRDKLPSDQDVKYVRVERSTGKFMRKFNLPTNANLDNITAACQDGLLTIIVPKHPLPDLHRPRTFEVPVSSTNLQSEGSWCFRVQFFWGKVVSIVYMNQFYQFINAWLSIIYVSNSK